MGTKFEFQWFFINFELVCSKNYYFQLLRVSYAKRSWNNICGIQLREYKYIFFRTDLSKHAWFFPLLRYLLLRYFWWDICCWDNHWDICCWDICWDISAEIFVGEIFVLRYLLLRYFWWDISRWDIICAEIFLLRYLGRCWRCEIFCWDILLRYWRCEKLCWDILLRYSRCQVSRQV